MIYGDENLADVQGKTIVEVFATTFKAIRKSAGVSQKALADYLGVQRNTITNYEAGATMPSVGNLIRLSEYFNVSVDYLLGRIDYAKPLTELNKEFISTNEKSVSSGQLYRQLDALPLEEREALMLFIELYLKDFARLSEGDRLEVKGFIRGLIVNAKRL